MASTRKNNLHAEYSLHAIANAFVAFVWTLIVSAGESEQSPYSYVIPIGFFTAALVFLLLDYLKKQSKKQSR